VSSLDDLKAESALLGAVMVSGSAKLATEITVDIRLAPEHFSHPANGHVWRAIMAVADRGDKPDATAVASEVEDRHRPAVTDAVGADMVLSNARSYACTVIRWAAARNIAGGLERIGHAVEAGDIDMAGTLAAELVPDNHGPSRKTRESRQSDLVDHAAAPPKGVLRWPWPELDRLLNGLWPAHLTVLGGITRHGKSVVADQIGEHVEKQGGTVCLYLTEMQELERDLRFVSRRTGLPFGRLLKGDLKKEQREHDTYLRAVTQLPFEIVRVGAMTTADIARDIRRRKWTFAVVDLLNALPGRKTEDIDHNVTMLAAAAQESGTHVLACQHLNRNRYIGDYPPEPTLNDLRGSGQLADLATNVLFVFRQAEEGIDGPTHHPGSDAYLEVAKAKNAQEGRMELQWNGSRMRFELPAVPGTVARAA
jgi:replicative DNA helicase